MISVYRGAEQKGADLPCFAIGQTTIMKQELNASKVFSSMAVFDMLREQLHLVFSSISRTVTGKVSLDRVTEFLRKARLAFFRSYQRVY